VVHGKPDWNRTSGTKTTYQLLDVGESAVRLGSIVSFDRRGDVIWLDDFEAGLAKWEVSGLGAGYAAAISTAAAKNGESSVKLTTGADSAKQVQIAHYMAYPVLGSFGLEVSFTLDVSLDYIRFQLEIYDGTNFQAFSAQYEVDTDDLTVYKGGVGYTSIATSLNLRKSDLQFHTIKLVGDYTTKLYNKLQLNGTEYDISDWATWEGSSATAPRLTALVLATATPSQNRSFYVDDVIITQNEP
jgi:hypothetical protein